MSQKQDPKVGDSGVSPSIEKLAQMMADPRNFDQDALKNMSEEDIGRLRQHQMDRMQAMLRKQNENENEEMNEWLGKIDNAHKLISDLTSGKITNEEFDRRANGEQR